MPEPPAVAEGEADAAAKCKEDPSNPKCIAPAEVLLNLKLAYDQSLKAKESDPTDWLNKVLTHSQAYFQHPSLKTKIKLKLAGEPKFFSDKTWTVTDETLVAAKPDVKNMIAESNANLVVMFCHTEGGANLGLAQLGSVCEDEEMPGDQTSINVWSETAAQTADVRLVIIFTVHCRIYF